VDRADQEDLPGYFAPGFQFVVTEASLREVVVRDRPRYTQWVYDVWTRGLSSPRA